MNIEIVSDIADIGQTAWNELVPDDGFYSSYEWTRSHEELYRRKRAYICVRDGSQLVAVAPVGFARHELSQSYSQQRFAELFGATGEYAVLGARRGYRNIWLTRAGLTSAQQADTVEAIADAALEVAADWKADAVVVPYLTASAMALLAGSRRLNQQQEAASEGILEVPGSFADYLAPLSRKRRWSIRKERTRPLEFGFRLQIEAITPDSADELAGLMAQVETKYEQQVSVEGLRRYLATTFVSDPAHARLFTCRNADGAVMSAALAFEWNRGLCVRATATDYTALPDDSFAHFNVVYYEPIEYCIRQGLGTIYFGIEALQAKLLRGCRAHSLSHAVLR